MQSWHLLVVNLSILIFVSCGSIEVPNEQVCVRLNAGAACAYTLFGPDKDVSEAKWLTKNVGRFSFSPSGFTEMRRFIEIACAKNRNCTKEQEEKMSQFVKRMDYLQERLDLDSE